MKYRDPSTGQFKSLTVKVSDTLPIGAMMSYGSLIAPEGWLICDGSAVSRTIYADLFAVIGTSYGDGDGSTTFNLPNKKGRNSVGYNHDDVYFNKIGKKGGERTHTLTIDEIPAHNHYIAPAIRAFTIGGNYEFPNAGAAYSAKEVSRTDTAGGGQAHNIIQPYEVDNWIIKATQPIVAPGTVRNEYSIASNEVYSCKYIEEEVKDSLSAYAQHLVDGTLIWTNPNPLSDFTEQTISLDLTKYDYIEIWYRTSSNKGTCSLKVKKNTGETRLLSFKYLAGIYGGDCLLTRGVSVTDTGVQFTMAHALGIAQNSNTTQHDGVIIPQYIIGYNNSNLHDN